MHQHHAWFLEAPDWGAQLVTHNLCLKHQQFSHSDGVVGRREMRMRFSLRQLSVWRYAGPFVDALYY